ncbi:ABC transporter ATP-binding protein [Pararobbsia silviterrae]|uniref:ABC transporter ATP-binding protein n=1 Tax=Pararobbsia silviterrae TaxID=1792498 RepID=UPI001F0C605C|nr:ABC transporter ATP-binding protein [Pararobbsia silviterrae]
MTQPALVPLDAGVPPASDAGHAADGVDARPASAPAVLTLDNVGKQFGAFHALSGVTLELRAGEVHCLLGENGAGKSTLCNVMFGVHQPDTGTLRLDGQPYRPRSPRDALANGIAMVHQHFSLVGDVTVLDNLLLGQSRGWLDRRARAGHVRRLVEDLGLALDPDAAIADLSVGERQRVEIVKCLIREPRLLVLDEPTAVLLPGEIDALLDVCARVAARGCAVVLVTHKLAEIRKIATRATVLQSGRVVARSDRPADEIDRLVRAMIERPGTPPAERAARGANAHADAAPGNDRADMAAGGHVADADADATADAPVSLDNAAVAAALGATPAVAPLRGVETAGPVAAPRTWAASERPPVWSLSKQPPMPAPSPYGRPLSDEVLLVDGLSVRDAQGVTRLDDCTLVVNRGEIVGIAGVEGNGQTELGAALAGMTRASAGRFFIEGKPLTDATPRELTAAGVGIVPEDRHAVGCVTEMSLIDNLLLNRLDEVSRHGFLRRRAMRAQAIELMARFDVRAASPDVRFGGLSGGNQQKAVLARELTLDPLVFLMAAQPTRGLDVGAVAAVYDHIRAARDRGVGVLLISSELDELMAVADRIIVLYRGKIMGSCKPDPLQRERIGAWMAGQTS